MSLNWFSENWSIKGVLENIQNLLSGITGWKAWLVGPILLAVNFLLGMIDFVLAIFGLLLTKVDELLASSLSVPGWDDSSIASDVWAYGNAVFPLDFALELIGLYFALTIACVTIRIIKSVIPTIS